MKDMPLIEDDIPLVVTKDSGASIEGGPRFEGAHEMLYVGEAVQPWSPSGMSTCSYLIFRLTLFANALSGLQNCLSASKISFMPCNAKISLCFGSPSRLVSCILLMSCHLLCFLVNVLV